MNDFKTLRFTCCLNNNQIFCNQVRLTFDHFWFLCFEMMHLVRMYKTNDSFSFSSFWLSAVFFILNFIYRKCLNEEQLFFIIGTYFFQNLSIKTYCRIFIESFQSNWLNIFHGNDFFPYQVIFTVIFALKKPPHLYLANIRFYIFDKNCLFFSFSLVI